MYKIRISNCNLPIHMVGRRFGAGSRWRHLNYRLTRLKNILRMRPCSGIGEEDHFIIA